MDLLTLPKILDIPKKLLPLIEDFGKYRIFLIEGGRGGGKSQAVARFLLYICSLYNLRAVCGRETQDTIQESVHQLLSDLINEYQLSYEIQKASIRCLNKDSTITFKGLREQGRFNIKGLEGTDVLWIEEGQQVTKPTIDIVLPTIRKTNSKIIVTMNRHLTTDPAYTMLVNRDDCLHIKINYLENEFCSKELLKEATICKEANEKDYDHIWLGNPLEQGEDALYSISDFKNGKDNAKPLQKGYGLRVAGFDIARYGDDCNAVVILQQMGALHWEEVYSDTWDNCDLNFTTGRILLLTNQHKADLAIIDEDGIGAGVFDNLTKGRQLDYFMGFRNPNIGYLKNKSFVNPRTINAYKAKDMLVAGHLNIKTQSIIDEMLTIKYNFDNNQRRLLVSKENMRKQGIKSPNMADALIMAVSLIGQVQEKQARQYEPEMQQSYSDDENLFKIAGIR